MPEKTTSYSLREALADLLPGLYKAYDLEAACDLFGMPARDDVRAMDSKRVYVSSRLAGVRLPEMLEITGRVLDEHPDDALARMVQTTGFRGVAGAMKNLIFAADGAKPRIVLADALSNAIEIVEGADRCLVYDLPLPPVGLNWGELVEWWSTTGSFSSANGAVSPARTLYTRLFRSLASDPERLLFKTYCERYGSGGDATPALIPQVYLHYDPYTARELKTMPGGELVRQRMDFLLLPSDRRRVIVEVDGQHHYAEDAHTEHPARPSPRLYAEMAAEDRRLRLAGYEVFRFGAYELMRPGGRDVVRQFFDELLARP